uniref:Outer membrane protein beta-barrel domain-containing protein n=1 Tax=uncultured delta proteobacterium HF4000_08N17 TaxID=710836 RepID=E0XVJ2_9DELT|nr:hypothetical protein [uncultured delta proteobacterium HF4000_08N17]
MSAIRLLALILLCTILLGACGRSDLIRVRLLSPISETKKDHAIYSDLTTSVSASKTTSADPKPSGGSLYFLFKSIGLGITKLTTQIEKEVRGTEGDTLILKEKTTLETNFIDLAFGIGENYSFMWGAGVLADGKLDTSLSYGNVYSGATDETIKHKYLSGHSIFLVVGHHGYGFETLLGFRTNYIKAEIEDSGSSAKTLKTRASLNYESTGIRITTNQLQLGIGVTF